MVESCYSTIPPACLRGTRRRARTGHGREDEDGHPGTGTDYATVVEFDR